MFVESVMVRRQADLIGEGLLAWKGAPDRAEALARLEVFTNLLATTAGWLGVAQEREWRDLFADGRDYELYLRGLELRDTYEVVLRVFEVAENQVAVAEAEGQVVAGAAAMRGAHQEVTALQADFRKRWPLITREQIQAGKDRIARGASITGEGIRRELASGDRPRHR